MTSIRFVLLLTALILALNVILVCGYGFVIGKLGRDDRKIGTNVVNRKVTIRCRNEIIRFPAKGQRNNRRLSAIRVTDNGPFQHGSKIYLVKGGPGYTYSEINVKPINGTASRVTLEYFAKR
ncbi:uncharacterized protein LOC106089094 [Stomoxys calcitrans]|uniref:Salivary secreted peptide n=1 Tax=Stomoxys calcitrans TaxID=35570 RepID=A0A1I8P259_STOCA|nr:uncharacterized protein LOC106089094 [Stomoxys calcitrans]